MDLRSDRTGSSAARGRLSSSARAASFAGCGTPSKQAGVHAVELSDKIEITPGKVSIGTMHVAKGLEFRASRSWRATTRSSHPRSASRMSRMMPISKKFMTANGTCFMWVHPRPRSRVGHWRRASIRVPDDSAELRSGSNRQWPLINKRDDRCPPNIETLLICLAGFVRSA